VSLPQTEERERWNHPTYDVAGRLFIAGPGDQTLFAGARTGPHGRGHQRGHHY
jgi:hypothetical protein